MLSGAILSGGRSTRMGEEKGLALLGGEPLISHVARTMGCLVDEVVVAVARGMSERYRVTLGGGFVIVEDERVDIGPLEGLVTAFTAARGEYVLVSPCDTPFLKDEVCRSIISHAIKKDGAVPRIGEKFEPLHGVYRRTKCLTAFSEALAEGKRKPVDAYDMLDLKYVDEDIVRVTDPRLESFWNINNPKDLELAEDRLMRGVF